jgi:transposase
MLAELRRARYGYLLALHIVRLGAAGRSPTAIAAVLVCSRSSVYRVVRAYRTGRLEGGAAREDGLRASGRRRVLGPTLKRSLRAILQAAPRAYGWGRTRWRWATVALEGQARRGLVVPAETVRRGLHELGWEWKRAKLVAKDDDPQRVEKLARIRSRFEHLRAGAALFVADGLDISLLPKGGSHGMPKGAQGEVRTPGTTEKRSRAGALDIRTGTLAHCVWDRKTTGLFLGLLDPLDQTYSARKVARRALVVDNPKIHSANEVEKWLAAHPRFELLYLPTYCPNANPIERACGAVHDQCTRHHTRKRMWHLVRDVEQHLQVNGPWPSALSELYYTPEVTAAVEASRAAESTHQEISQLAA